MVRRCCSLHALSLDGLHFTAAAISNAFTGVSYGDRDETHDFERTQCIALHVE